MGLVTVAPGVQLAVVEAGGHPPEILMVHGLASNARLWMGVGAHLSRVGRAWRAIDLRGHGLSSKPRSGYDFATISDDLASAIGGDRMVVVGQSWGGNVVVELASRHPELVSAVVCVDGGFIKLSEDFDSWADVESSLRPPDFSGLSVVEFEAMARTRLGHWPETGIAGQLSNFESTEDGTVRPRLSWDNHRQILEALWGQDPDAVASNVVVPMLVIATNGDDRKAARVESFVSAAPLGASVWVEADHDVHGQHPELVAEWILGVGS